MKKLLPMLAVLGSIVSLCVGTSYGKRLFPAIGAEGTTAFRVAFSAVILLAVWRPWRKPLGAAGLKAVIIYGVTLGLMNLMFYMALATLPLGPCIAMEFTGPLAVAIMSSRRPLDFLWIALAVIGLGLLVPLGKADAAALNPVGIGFALASALMWALYIIFGKRVGHLHAGQSTSLGMTVASLVVAPIGIFHASSAMLDWQLVGSGILLAIFSSAIPYTLEMYALKRLPKATFSVLCSMEPAVGAVAGMFMLHELLTTPQWLAIACIMGASIGSSLNAVRTADAPVPIDDVSADTL